MADTTGWGLYGSSGSDSIIGYFAGATSETAIFKLTGVSVGGTALSVSGASVSADNFKTYATVDNAGWASLGSAIINSSTMITASVSGTGSVHGFSFNAASNGAWFGAGSENLTLLGGSKADTVYIGKSNISVSGAEGKDIFSVSGAISNITIQGGAAEDSIFANGLTSIPSGKNIYFYGGAGSDTVEVAGLSVGDGNFYVYGDSGTDLIKISNASITGGGVLLDGGSDADVFNISNISVSGSANFSVLGGTENDSIYANGVSVGGGSVLFSGGIGADTVEVAGLQVAGGTVSLDGGSGTDLIKITGASITGGGVYLDGSSDADVFSLSNISVATGANFSVYGGTGDDSIYVSNFSVSGSALFEGGAGTDTITFAASSLSAGTVSLSGGDGVNIFNVNDVSVGSGAHVYVYGNASASTDTFYISNAQGISLISANNDSDTFAFDVSKGSAISISGFNATDKISLNAMPTSIGVANDALIIQGNSGTISIFADSRDSLQTFSDVYTLQVTTGTTTENASILADFIDPYAWHSISGTDAGFKFSREYGTSSTAVMSISGAGLSKNLIGASLNASMNAKNLTFDVNWLDNNILSGSASVSVYAADGYSVALSATSETAEAGFESIGANTWAYNAAGTQSFNFASLNGGSKGVSVISGSVNQSALVSLAGLADNISIGTGDNVSLKFTEGTISLSASAFGTGQMSVYGSGDSIFTFNFGAAAANVYAGSSSINVLGSDNADSITVGNFNQISVYGGTGNDSLVATGGTNISLNGGFGNDSITVGQVSINSGVYYISGDSGTDLININNISVTGGDFKVYGGADADSITVNTVSISGGSFVIDGDSGTDLFNISGISISGGVLLDGGSDADVFNISNISVSGSANFSVLGGTEGDSLNISGVSVGGGSVLFDGGAGNDSITAGSFNITGGNISISGGDGSDTFALSNITVAGGTVNVYGGAGEDSITISNVSVGSGGAFYVYGGESTGSEADYFNITGSKGISIISGTNDSDTLALGTGSFISVSGLDSTDIISLSAAPAAGSANVSVTADGVIILQGASIVANGMETTTNIASIYNVSVMAAGQAQATLLGNLIDPYAWHSIGSAGDQGFRFGHAYSDNTLISVSAAGVKNNVIAASLDASMTGTNNRTLLFDVENWLDTSGTVSLYSADGYGVSLSASSISASAGWSGSGSVTSTTYFAAGYDSLTISSTSVTNVSIISSQASQTALIQLNGLTNSWASLAAPNANSEVTITKDAIGTTQISVSGAGYALTFATDASVMLLSDNTSIIGSVGADTITVGQSLISGSVSIDGAGGNDVFSLADISVGAAGNIAIFGGTDNDSLFAENISVTSGGTFTFDAGAGNDTVTIENISVGSGAFSVYGGAGADVYNITSSTNVFITNSDGSDTFVISSSTNVTASGSASLDAFTVGYSSNISLNGGNGDNTFAVTSSTAVTMLGGDGEDTFDISSSTNITAIGNASVDVFNVGYSSVISLDGGEGADIFNINSSTGVSIISGDKDSDTFAFNFGNAAEVSIGGFDVTDKISVASGSISKASISTDGVLIFNDKVSIKANGITTDTGFTTLYNVSVYGGEGEHSILGDLVDPIHWSSIDGAEGFTFGRTHTDTSLISLTGGLADTVNSSTFVMDSTNHTLLFDASWLTGFDAQVSIYTAGSYDVSLASSVLGAGGTGWAKGANDSVAIYYGDGQASVQIFAGSGAGSSIVSVSNMPTALIELDGLSVSSAWGFESIKSGSNAFTVTANAIDSKKQITVTAEDYALTFATDASVLLTSDGTSIIGSEGNDSIALADNLSVISGSVSINGMAGNDVFTLSNISVGGDKGALAVLGGDGADSLTISNISVGGGVYLDGGSGTDVFSISNISVASGANFSVYGGTENDSIYASGISVGGGSVLFDGGTGNDSITAGSFNITSGNISISGGAGSDTFALSNISVGGGTVNIYGGADNDSITLNDVSVTSGALNIYGGETDGTDSDLFNISKVSGISIISGTNDSDTFAFNVGDAGALSIAGLDNSDIISLSAAPTKDNVKLEGGTLVLGSVSVTANAFSDAAAFAEIYNVSVKGSTGEASILAEFIDPYAWHSISGTDAGFRYGREYGTENTALISISGAGLSDKASIGALTASMSGDTLLFNIPDWINSSSDEKVSVYAAAGYTVSLAADTVEATASWVDVGKSSVVSWKGLGNTGYALTSLGAGQDSVISITDNRNVLVSLDGVSSTANASLFANVTAEGMVSIGAGAFGTGQLSVYGAADSVNYTFDLSAANALNVAAGSSSITIIGGSGKDTIAIGAFENISVFGGNEADVFNIATGASSITVNGGAGNDSINVAGGSAMSLIGDAGDDVFNITSGTDISISGGAGSDTFIFADGVTAAITDLESIDVIQVDSVAASFDTTNKVLVVGGASGASLKVNGFESLGAFTHVYHATITDGKGNSSLLGDLIDRKEWVITAEGNDSIYVYGRQDGDDVALISIGGGLNSVATAAALKDATANDTLTVSTDWLGLENVPFALNGGGISLAATEKTLEDRWAVNATEAIYYASGNASYTVDMTQKAITVKDERLSLVTLSGAGIATGANASLFAFDTNTNVATLEKGAGAFGTGQLSVYGAADSVNYTFNLSNASSLNVVAGTDSITVLGGEGDDQFLIGTGLKNISIFGGAGDDSITVNSTAGEITVTGGDGSDTFIFGSGVTAAITDLESIDVIQVDSVAASFDTTNKVLVVGGASGASLKVNGFESLGAFTHVYHATITDGKGNSSLLGDLIDRKEWVITAEGNDSIYVYGRQDGDDVALISIGGGLNSVATAAALKDATANDTLTVSTDWLGLENVPFALNGGGISLAADASNSLAAYWNTETDETAIYYDKGNASYSIVGSEIQVTDERASLVSFAGLTADSLTSDNFKFVVGENVASLSADAINGDVITVYGNGDSVYTFDFSAAAASVGANVAAGTGSINILGSNEDDTFTIGAGLENISVYGGIGDDSITVNSTEGDITVTGGAGSDTFIFADGVTAAITDLESIDVIQVDSVAASFDTTNKVLVVGGASGASLKVNGFESLGSFKDVYNVKVTDGTETKSLGDLIDGEQWRATGASVAAYGRQYGTDSEKIVLSGLANLTEQVNALNETEHISGTLFTFDSDVLKGQTTPISLTSNIYYAVLDEKSAVKYHDEEWATGSGKITYTSARNDAGYKVTARDEGENTDVIKFVAAESNTATISGLASNINLKYISFDTSTKVFTLSEGILNNENVVLAADNDDYKLSLASGIEGTTTRSNYWIASDTSIANYYEGQGTVAGYDLDSDGTTIKYTAESNAAVSTIQITGLKNISEVDSLNVKGIELNSTTSEVTIAKNNISTNGATVTAGAGYNYTLGGKGKLTADIASGTVSLTGSTSNDVLTNKGNADAVINGGNGNDVISIVGSGAATLTGGVGNDTYYINSNTKAYINYETGKEVINGYTSDDTINLAEGKTVKEAAYSNNALVFTLNNGKITFNNIAETQEVTIGNNIYEGNVVYDLAKSTLTVSKKFTATSISDAVNETSVTLINATNVSQGLTVTAKNSETTILGGKGNDNLSGMAGGNNSLDGGAGNDILNGGSGNYTLTGGKGNDTFVYSGGNDVITDYGNGKDVISLSSDPVNVALSADKKDLIMTSATGNLTIVGGGGKVISVNSGSGITGQIYGDNSTFNTKKTGVTLNADYSGEFNAADYSALVTIDGSNVTGNVSLTGNGKANKIYGGKGADTLNGGSGNDTLTGGDGKDTFVYSGGKDVITDFVPTEDNISIANGSVSDITNAKYSSDGKTLTLTFNKQTLTINGKEALTGKSISINGAAYTFDNNQIFTADGKSVTMYSAFKGAYTAADAIVSVDGSAANGAMNIVANSNNNIISGGKKSDTLNGGAGNDYIDGGAGNDSIYGGAGDDTLTGGNGKDIFVFGENDGYNIITDYISGQDKIKLINGASITGSVARGNDWEFTAGSTTIKVTGGKGTSITIIDSNGRTTTQTYGEESSNARTLDLLYDNNFMTDDSSLDDITDAKYSVTDIDTDSKDEIAKVEDLLTYSDKK